MSQATVLPDLIAESQTSEESFLRQIFVRDQMAEWSKHPLIMAKADGVHYWDVQGRRYLDALSGIYVVSVGHNNRRVIEAIRSQLDRPGILAADARHEPRRRAARQPPGRTGPRRPRGGQVPVRRLRGHGGGDQAGAAVSSADRVAGKVQDHQPLPVLARLDARRPLGLRPEVAQVGQRADGPRFPPRLPADLLPLPVRQVLPRLRNHLRDVDRRHDRDGRPRRPSPR